MEELQKKIASCAAFRGILKEKEVATMCKSHRWNTQHGVYYQDVDSEKHREIDVLARQIWTKKTKFGEQCARLTVPIEVKTMMGFHIVVSPVTERQWQWAARYRNNICLANPGNKYVRLREDLTAGGFPDEAAKALIADMHKFAWPGETARLKSLMLVPPEELVFTSFRETNIGGEKELENSVFWRASQNLKSAVKSIAESIYQYHIGWILGGLVWDQSKQRELEDFAFEWMCRQVQFVDIIHPVVVTDATLWTVEKDAPQEVGWARFALHEFNGSSEWWCDLVNSNHFDKYIAKMTDHYVALLKKSKAKINMWP